MSFTIRQRRLKEGGPAQQEPEAIEEGLVGITWIHSKLSVARKGTFDSLDHWDKRTSDSGKQGTDW